MAGSSSDRLNERGGAAQEALLISMEDGHEGDFRQVPGHATIREVSP